ncbi:hypothetical protein BX666DRAFT_2030587 [Dichotomocladium elegans]|nr:hypothetical protein BX666DRAFT_2030587 [Dichotomocladium elegans]
MNHIKTLHWLQWIHVGNTVLCVLTALLLIDVAKHVRSFISNGSQLSGFGNYSTFAYPATYVYMFIPVICSSILGAILACDPSPSFKAWKPSKTLISTIGSLAFSLVFAALLPTIPGADIITAPNTALACTWTNYMEWRTIFNNPEIYPWPLLGGYVYCTYTFADVAAHERPRSEETAERSEPEVDGWGISGEGRRLKHESQPERIASQRLAAVAECRS